ncbi:MAG TPA: ribosome maturation factor RimM [Microvirga sp.]
MQKRSRSERVLADATQEVGATPPSPTLPHKGGEGKVEGAAGGAPPDHVLLGEFGRAHGLKGEVRLKSFTADPQAIAAYGPLLAGARMLTLSSVRPAPGGQPDFLIAQVQGVTTREAAEALNRVQLHIPRDKLPPPDEEDEFLLADLIGLAVVNAAGEPLGTIVGVPNYGSGDLLDIAPRPGGPTALLPFTKAFVPVVDIAGRRLVIDPPADLFEPAKAKPDHPEDAA